MWYCAIVRGGAGAMIWRDRTHHHRRGQFRRVPPARAAFNYPTDQLSYDYPVTILQQSYNYPTTIQSSSILQPSSTILQLSFNYILHSNPTAILWLSYSNPQLSYSNPTTILQLSSTIQQISFNYPTTIFQLSNSNPKAIVQLSFNYPMAILQLSYSYPMTIVQQSSTIIHLSYNYPTAILWLSYSYPKLPKTNLNYLQLSMTAPELPSTPDCNDCFQLPKNCLFRMPWTFPWFSLTLKGNLF